MKIRTHDNGYEDYNNKKVIMINNDDTNDNDDNNSNNDHNNKKKIEITRAMAKTKLHRCVSTTNTKIKQR